MPASMIPRKSLICGNCSVRQLSDEGMNTDLTATGLILIPVVVILVFAQQAIVGTHVAFKVWIVRSGGMHHDAFGNYGSACFETGVVCEYQFS